MGEVLPWARLNKLNCSPHLCDIHSINYLWQLVNTNCEKRWQNCAIKCKIGHRIANDMPFLPLIFTL